MPRRLGGMGRGAALALLVHAGLIVAIAFGVNWRRSAESGVEAELWAAVPQVAAPAPVAPPTPAPKPEPKVEPPAPPPPPPPKAEPKPEPAPDPQIAIEKAKREREEKERLAQLEREKLERERLEKEREREKARVEQEKREKLERERAEKEKREAAAKAERARQEEAKRLAEAREQQLQRVLGMAGATGTAPAGTAAQSAGPSASYAGRVIARLKPLSVFSESVSGNPKVEVELKLGSDGTILAKRIVKRSGVPAWDDAVLRAIEKAEVMPRDTDGRVPSAILISWGPND
jgi:colicin import membrane protein